jgi:hypothetical protein
MLVVSEISEWGCEIQLTVVRMGEVCWVGMAVNLFIHDRGVTVVL